MLPVIPRGGESSAFPLEHSAASQPGRASVGASPFESVINEKVGKDRDNSDKQQSGTATPRPASRKGPDSARLEGSRGDPSDKALTDVSDPPLVPAKLLHKGHKMNLDAAAPPVSNASAEPPTSTTNLGVSATLCIATAGVASPVVAPPGTTSATVGSRAQSTDIATRSRGNASASTPEKEGQTNAKGPRQGRVQVSPGSVPGTGSVSTPTDPPTADDSRDNPALSAEPSAAANTEVQPEAVSPAITSGTAEQVLGKSLPDGVGTSPGSTTPLPNEPSAHSAVEGGSGVGIESSGGGIGKAFLDGLGTSAAQEDAAMKKSEKPLKNAEFTQQNLPSDASLSAVVREPAALAVDSSNHVVLAPAGAPGEAQLLSLQKTHDLISTHALRLSHSQNDSLTVVIEPGAGTRLSLELRFNNGRIEAQAQLHRGDFEFFSDHWADLQHRLQPQGVNLASLERFVGGGADQSGSQDRRAAGDEKTFEHQSRAEAVLERDPVAARSKVKTRIRQYAGWETWA